MLVFLSLLIQMAQSVKFQLRRDTAANWTANNPTLAPGEPGFEVLAGYTGTAFIGNRMKIGSGNTGWNYLPYVDCGTTGATGLQGPTGVQGATGPASQGSWTAVVSDPTQIVQSATVAGTFTKIAPSGWSGYVSSAQAYSSGCYASFTLGSGTSFIGLGVSGTSPAAIPTGIENSIYAFQGAQSGLFLYANGVQVTGPGLTGGAGSWGSSAVGDSFTIQYDGANITFYQNGVQVGPSVPRTLRTPLYLYAIQNEQGSFMRNLVFGSGGGSGGGGAGVTGYGQNSWTPVLYNMVQSGATAGTFTNTFTGTPAWGTSQVSSLQGFSQAYASFTLPFPSTTNSYLGLSTTPTPVSGAIPESGPPPGFWGIYSYGTGVGSPTIYILENGAPTLISGIGGPGTTPVLATDVFTTTYDGVNFNYYQNSTLLRTTAYTLPAGSLFYLMGQHSVPATSFANVVFGPSAPTVQSQGSWTPFYVSSTGNTDTIVPSSITGTFTKNGSTAWTAAVRSVQAYNDGAFASLQIGSSGGAYVNSAIGLNTNTNRTYAPTAGNPAGDITYMIVSQVVGGPPSPYTGSVNIYVNGTFLNSPGSWVPGDTIGLKQVGSLVVFCHNDRDVYSIPLINTNPLYLDTRIYDSGATINNLVFGRKAAASSGSPLFWSYVVGATNGSLTPRITPSGSTGQYIANGDLVRAWTAVGATGLAGAPININTTPQTSLNFAFPFSYEPPGLTMLSRYDTSPAGVTGYYASFQPRISGLYQVTVNMVAGQNANSDGFPNGLSFIRLYSPNGIGVVPGSGLAPSSIIAIENLCNNIFTASGQNNVASSTTFLCNMVTGSEYALCAGSVMNNSRAIPVYDGTQIQFRLLTNN
jgi:hypothetical protein